MIYKCPHCNKPCRVRFRGFTMKPQAFPLLDNFKTAIEDLLKNAKEIREKISYLDSIEERGVRMLKIIESIKKESERKAKGVGITQHPEGEGDFEEPTL